MHFLHVQRDVTFRRRFDIDVTSNKVSFRHHSQFVSRRRPPGTKVVLFFALHYRGAFAGSSFQFLAPVKPSSFFFVFALLLVVVALRARRRFCRRASRRSRRRRWITTASSRKNVIRRRRRRRRDDVNDENHPALRYKSSDWLSWLSSSSSSSLYDDDDRRGLIRDDERPARVAISLHFEWERKKRYCI